VRKYQGLRGSAIDEKFEEMKAYCEGGMANITDMQ